MGWAESLYGAMLDQEAEFTKLVDAAKQGDASSQTEVGRHFLERGNFLTGEPQPDYLAALEWFRLAAQQGHPQAQDCLAIMYASGWGVPQDHAEAALWYRKAAEQNYVESQRRLGKAYAEGRGMPHDPVQAVAWYTRAAEQWDYKSATDLSEIYFSGHGLDKNFVLAYMWKAIASWNGFALVGPELSNQMSASEITEAQRLTVQWFRKLADQGHPWAQCVLGEAYADTQGAPHNDAEAAAWYRKAAAQGYSRAQYFLGRACANGLGTPQNDPEALDWFTRAAEQGHREAADELGERYFSGRGVERNLAQAYFWHTIGACGDLRHGPASLRQKLIEAMSASEVSEAELLVKKWKERRSKQ